MIEGIDSSAGLFTGGLLPALRAAPSAGVLWTALQGLTQDIQWVNGLRARPPRLFMYGGGATPRLSPDGQDAVTHLIAAQLRSSADPLLLETQRFFTALGEQLVLDSPIVGAWWVRLQPKNAPLVSVDLCDTGEGYAQVLPVLVALARAKVGGPRLLCLEQPELGILVENADNDWSFLLGVLRVVLRAPELSRMDRAVKERWAVPLHGGGDTLGARLNARLEDVATRLRTFVMFDSDRLHPEEFAPSWTPERPGQRPVACEAFHWELRAQAALPDRYWRLQRRFIESYMPKDELAHGAARGTHADAVEAFLRMNRDQRWHFNMKKGFQGDSRRDDWERCRDLYDSLNERPEDRRALEKGFGGTLADLYQEALTRAFAWDAEAQEEASTVKRKLLGLL